MVFEAFFKRITFGLSFDEEDYYDSVGEEFFASYDYDESFEAAFFSAHPSPSDDEEADEEAISLIESFFSCEEDNDQMVLPPVGGMEAPVSKGYFKGLLTKMSGACGSLYGCIKAPFSKMGGLYGSFVNCVSVSVSQVNHVLLRSLVSFKVFPTKLNGLLGSLCVCLWFLLLSLVGYLKAPFNHWGRFLDDILWQREVVQTLKGEIKNHLLRCSNLELKLKIVSFRNSTLATEGAKLLQENLHFKGLVCRQKKMFDGLLDLNHRLGNKMEALKSKLVDVQSQLRDKVCHNDSLSAEVRSLKLKLVDFESKLEIKQQQNGYLTGKVANLETKLVDVESQLEEKKHQNDDLTSEVGTLKSMLGNAMSQLGDKQIVSGKVADLESKLVDAQSELKDEKHQNGLLFEEIEFQQQQTEIMVHTHSAEVNFMEFRLKNQEEVCESMKKVYSVEIGDLKSKLAVAESKLEDKQRQNDHLTGLVEGLESTLVVVESELADSKQQVNDLSVKVGNLKFEIVDIEAELRYKQHETEYLSGQLHHTATLVQIYSSGLDSLKVQLKDQREMCGDMKQVESQLRDKQQECHHLAAEVEDLESELVAVDSESRKQQLQNDRLTGEIGNLESKLVDVGSQLREKQHQSDDFSVEVGSLKLKLVDVESKLEVKQLQNDHLTDKVDYLESKLADVESKLADVESKLADVESKLEIKQHQNDHLTGEIGNLESKLVDVGSQLREKQHQSDDFSVEVGSLKLKLVDVESKLEVKQLQKDHLTDKVGDLEFKLVDIESQLKIKQLQNDHLTDKVGDLEFKLADVESKLEIKQHQNGYLTDKVANLDSNLVDVETQLKIQSHLSEYLSTEVKTLRYDLSGVGSRLAVEYYKNECLGTENVVLGVLSSGLVPKLEYSQKQQDSLKAEVKSLEDKLRDAEHKLVEVEANLESQLFLNGNIKDGDRRFFYVEDLSSYVEDQSDNFSCGAEYFTSTSEVEDKDDPLSPQTGSPEIDRELEEYLNNFENILAYSSAIGVNGLESQLKDKQDECDHLSAEIKDQKLQNELMAYLHLIEIENLELQLRDREYECDHIAAEMEEHHEKCELMVLTHNAQVDNLESQLIEKQLKCEQLSTELEDQKEDEKELQDFYETKLKYSSKAIQRRGEVIEELEEELAKTMKRHDAACDDLKAKYDKELREVRKTASHLEDGYIKYFHLYNNSSFTLKSLPVGELYVSAFKVSRELKKGGCDLNSIYNRLRDILDGLLFSWKSSSDAAFRCFIKVFRLFPSPLDDSFLDLDHELQVFIKTLHVKFRDSKNIFEVLGHMVNSPLKADFNLAELKKDVNLCKISIRSLDSSDVEKHSDDESFWNIDNADSVWKTYAISNGKKTHGKESFFYPYQFSDVDVDFDLDDIDPIFKMDYDDHKADTSNHGSRGTGFDNGDECNEAFVQSEVESEIDVADIEVDWNEVFGYDILAEANESDESEAEAEVEDESELEDVADIEVDWNEVFGYDILAEADESDESESESEAEAEVEDNSDESFGYSEDEATY